MDTNELKNLYTNIGVTKQNFNKTHGSDSSNFYQTRKLDIKN